MDDDVERLLDAFRELFEGMTSEEVHVDGFFHGHMVTYANGMQMFHPYIPLMSSGVVVDPNTCEVVSNTVEPFRLLTSEEWREMQTNPPFTTRYTANATRH